MVCRSCFRTEDRRPEGERQANGVRLRSLPADTRAGCGLFTLLTCFYRQRNQYSCICRIQTVSSGWIFCFFPPSLIAGRNMQECKPVLNVQTTAPAKRGEGFSVLLETCTRKKIKKYKVHKIDRCLSSSLLCYVMLCCKCVINIITL